MKVRSYSRKSKDNIGITSGCHNGRNEPRERFLSVIIFVKNLEWLEFCRQIL